MPGEHLPVHLVEYPKVVVACWLSVTELGDGERVVLGLDLGAVDANRGEPITLALNLGVADADRRFTIAVGVERPGTFFVQCMTDELDEPSWAAVDGEL